MKKFQSIFFFKAWKWPYILEKKIQLLKVKCGNSKASKTSNRWCEVIFIPYYPRLQETKGIVSDGWYLACLGTFVSGILVCIKLPWAPIKKLSTFITTSFTFHLLFLHPLGPTIDVRIAWAIIKATFEFIYFTCSKSSWGGTLIEAPTISLLACLETHFLWKDVSLYGIMLLLTPNPNMF